MLIRPIARFALPVAALVCASSAFANVYVVDAAGSPGSTFTDIPAAIAASASGDVLRVLAGNYSAFTLDRGVVIIGYGTVNVAGAMTVTNVAATDRAAIVDVHPTSVSVVNCFGPVVLQRLGNVSTVSISQCNDVRIDDVHVDPQAPLANTGADAIQVDFARVELVEVNTAGAWGASPPAAPGQSTNGGHALNLGAGARAFASRLAAVGGIGGVAFVNPLGAGNGSSAIRLATPSSLFLSGPASQVYGGAAGIAVWTSSGECYADGNGACAIDGDAGGSVRVSGATTTGSWTDTSFHCSGGVQAPGICGVSALLPATPDPAVRVVGTPTAGGSLTLEVTGAPGESVSVYLGRAWIVEPTPGIAVERLVPQSRTVNLGVIPASGTISVNFGLAPTLPPGTTLGVQAIASGPSGLRRSNSAPMVVR